MTAQEFNTLFDECVGNPLTAAGFHASSKSLYLMDDTNLLSLIRQAGRGSGPTFTQYALCFRHRFLRDLNEAVPPGFTSEAFCYPFKFKPSQLRQVQDSTWHFTSQNLSFPAETVVFGDMKEQQLAAWLQDVARQIVEIGVPWVHSMTPSRALTQIETFGKQEWCERLWIEDYRNHLKETGDAQQEHPELQNGPRGRGPF